MPKTRLKERTLEAIVQDTLYLELQATFWTQPPLILTQKRRRSGNWSSSLTRRSSFKLISNFRIHIAQYYRGSSYCSHGQNQKNSSDEVIDYGTDSRYTYNCRGMDRRIPVLSNCNYNFSFNRGRCNFPSSLLSRLMDASYHWRKRIYDQCLNYIGLCSWNVDNVSNRTFNLVVYDLCIL